VAEEEMTLIEVLRSEFRGLADNVQGMRNDIKTMSGKLERIAVIEERHNVQAQALERAFSAIQSLETDHREHLDDAHAKRAIYDKALWMATGFITAVSVGWTLFGVYLTGAVDGNIKAVSAMQMHVHTDEVTRMEQVREAHKAENVEHPNNTP
jgi:hypothetical protein